MYLNIHYKPYLSHHEMKYLFLTKNSIILDLFDKCAGLLATRNLVYGQRPIIYFSTPKTMCLLLVSQLLQ